MTMIIALVIITVDTIMHNQVSIVINVIIITITIISSKNMLANQSSFSSPSPQTASKPSFFHHHNHNPRHHNAQETFATSRQRKHQRGKKRIQPIKVTQNRLQHKCGSIKLNMHHTKISRITLRKAASTQSQSQSQPSPTAEYNCNSSTICTTATRKETSKQCEINIENQNRIHQSQQTIATGKIIIAIKTIT
jgi:hypothetical protein